MAVIDHVKHHYLRKAIRRSGHARPPARLPVQLYPELIEDDYAQALDALVTYVKELIDARIKPLLPKLQKTYGRVRKVEPRRKVTHIDEDEDLRDLADQIKEVKIEVDQAYTAEELARMARLTGISVDEWNAEQLNGQLRGIVEIDLFGDEAGIAKELGAFVAQNVSLISSIDDEYLNQVETLVATSIRAGVRWEDIADQIDERYDVARSRAELIARDQVGKFNGQLTELRQTELGIEKYTWHDSGDARVRESHHLNSIRETEYGVGVYAWDDPPETGHPGEDYECRCGAEPYLGDFYGDDSN